MLPSSTSFAAPTRAQATTSCEPETLPELAGAMMLSPSDISKVLESCSLDNASEAFLASLSSADGLLPPVSFLQGNGHSGPGTSPLARRFHGHPYVTNDLGSSTPVFQSQAHTPPAFGHVFPSISVSRSGSESPIPLPLPPSCPVKAVTLGAATQLPQLPRLGSDDSSEPPSSPESVRESVCGTRSPPPPPAPLTPHTLNVSQPQSESNSPSRRPVIDASTEELETIARLRKARSCLVCEVSHLWNCRTAVFSYQICNLRKPLCGHGSLTLVIIQGNERGVTRHTDRQVQLDCTTTDVLCHGLGCSLQMAQEIVLAQPSTTLLPRNAQSAALSYA
eukprot:m.296163 g.296163  ORF g.296163 m.296163 type:complete len:335 (+) comp15855_c0_seq49:891-1895(+)